MVLSGINNGPNLGTDVIYSGTVSAAIEGFVQNKPSIAFSLNEFNVSKEVYSQVSKHASKIVNDIKDKLNILNDCILNVNIPNGEVKGTKITRLGERKYENVLEERVSPHGKRYFWIGGKVKELEQENDSDIIAIEEGYITITPVNIDMTNNKKIEINFFILRKLITINQFLMPSILFLKQPTNLIYCRFPCIKFDIFKSKKYNRIFSLIRPILFPTIPYSFISKISAGIFIRYFKKYPEHIHIQSFSESSRSCKQ